MEREVIGGGSAVRLVSWSFVPHGDACVARGIRVRTCITISLCFFFSLVRVNFNRAVCVCHGTVVIMNRDSIKAD